jgi:hypothetical protein
MNCNRLKNTRIERMILKHRKIIRLAIWHSNRSRRKIKFDFNLDHYEAVREKFVDYLKAHLPAK